MIKHKAALKKIKLPRQLQRHWQVFVVMAAFLLVGGIYALITSFASAASMTLSPGTLPGAAQEVALDSNFTVTVRIDSGGANVNAVEADLNYPASKMDFVSVDATGSDFDFPIVTTPGTGTIAISRGSTSPISGNKLVAKVIFKAKATGTANVTIANSSALIETDSGDSTNILSVKNNASYSIVDKTKPSTPTGLTQDSSTTTLFAIGMTWTASTDNVGVTGYNIYRNGTKIDTSPTNSYVDNSGGLTPNTSYNYYVEAYDAVPNTSDPSATKSFKTNADTQPPTIPGTPTLTSATFTSITFHWTASTDNVGVTTYRIYRDTTSSPIGTSTDTNYTDSGLVAGSDHTYYVSAGDAAGLFSAKSAGALLSTSDDDQKPTTPTGLTVAGKTTTTVSLSWTASTDNVGVVGYKIYRNNVLLPTTTATTSFTDTGLTCNGVSYTYRVQAFDAAGLTSAKSSPATAITDYKKGDVDGDCRATFADFTIMIRPENWNQSGKTRAEGDLTGEGDVTVADVGQWLSNRE